MEYFGINDIAELPTPKEFVAEVNTIGENPEQNETSEQSENLGQPEADGQA
jgi:segregation and condensation protein B